MKQVALLCLACAVVAACGADGEPNAPSGDTPVTSNATIGVGVGSSGTRVVGSVGVNMGPVRIGVGF